MKLQGIKIRLTIIVGSLLLVAMLLVNFILIMLWQRDALQREIIRDQVVLDRIVDRLPVDLDVLRNVSLDSFLFADFYSSPEETGRIVVLTGREKVVAASSSGIFPPLLTSTLNEAIRTGRPVVHSSGTFLGFYNPHGSVLVSAQPLIRQGQVIGAVAVNRSLKSMLQSLWRVEKITLIYILINLLILSVSGFFRMRQVVVQPIERLVALADRYTDNEPVFFAAESSGGEFGQLATSLNSMLARIESDRQTLEKNLAKLEAANLQLKKQQQEMIRTEKLASVGRLAAGLAHEIGNPLGVVQGYLGLLGQVAGQSDEHHDFIKRADQELSRVNTLLRQLLDFARISKGEPEVFSLHNLLGSILEMVKVQPVFRDIEIQCCFDAAKDTVCVDQDRLRQVFVNCLLNSADAVISAKEAGQGRITVSTAVDVAQGDRDQQEFIRVQVADNGAGMTNEQKDLIFDPFYTTKEPGKGTGLGLSVSLSIIESMDGRMEMDSIEGQGSVLSIFLPLTFMLPDGDGADATSRDEVH